MIKPPAMKPPLKTLNIVGAGRVGQTLAHLFQQSGLCEVQDIYARDAERGQQAAAFIGTGTVVSTITEMRPASLWMLSVADTAIAAVAAELAAVVDLGVGAASFAGAATAERAASLSVDPAAAGNATPPTVFHCSGFWSAEALAPLLALGWRGASVHPVRSFADPALAVAAFEGTPCGLEGERAAVESLSPLFRAIGGECFKVESERKALYHAAAVFASNFTVVLQSLAQEAWQDAGVPEALASQLQSSLVRGTLDNVFQLGPAAAITGPAARGDTAVVQRQGAAVAQWNPAAARLYEDLSALARRLAVDRTTRQPESPVTRNDR